MAEYAYDYDATASNAANLVKGEVHSLADYPNAWRCIIPTFAPFYRKDLIITLVSTGQVLHEGIDYYLGHYFQDASEENKLPIFGSVMIVDLDLVGDIEFTQYRTLGGRYNLASKYISAHLSQEDLADPRNLDWTDVGLLSYTIPAVEAPSNVTEAQANDVVTKSLVGLRDALVASAEASTANFDELVTKLTALESKVRDQDIKDHETRLAPHGVTTAQLGALAKDADAVNAVKAYGYSLTQLTELVNSLGVNGVTLEQLVSLSGDELRGMLTLSGNNLLVRNALGTSVISLDSGDLSIVAKGNVIIDSEIESTGLASVLRAGNNQLSLHSDSGDYVKAVLYTPGISDNITRVGNGALEIAPTYNWSTSESRFCVYKQVYFPAGTVSVRVMSDNRATATLDGAVIIDKATYANYKEATVEVTEGWHWIGMSSYNGVGPGWIAAYFEIGEYKYVTDDTWWLKHTDADNVDADIIAYPTVNNNAIYNGFYLIHVGNIAEYAPDAEYTDTYLHTDSTGSVKLVGRGIASSPMSGEVTYPYASTTSPGIFRLSHSISSNSTSIAASANAVSKLKVLEDEKLDNTTTINGKPLTVDITITAADLGLGNVNNTKPSDKPASNDFIAALAGKAVVGHTHSQDDFSDIPLATQSEFGVSKLTTEESDRIDIVATPVMLNETYLEYLDAEAAVAGKMPSAPFNIMQYGGFGYLPIPIQGNYAAVGTNISGLVMAVEATGELVMLREATDAIVDGVFYWYADLDSSGKFNNITATSFAYAPDYVDDGDYVTGVTTGSDGVFLARTALGKTYVVLTYNTMDADKHVGLLLNDVSLSHYDIRVFLVDDTVYISQCITYYATGTDYKLWSVNVANPSNGKSVIAEPVLLSGTDRHGNVQTDVEEYSVTSDLVSEDETDIPNVILLPDHDWISFGIYNGSRDNTMSLENGVLRVHVLTLMAFTNNTTQRSFYIEQSFRVDLETKQVVDESIEAGIEPWVLDGSTVIDYVSPTPVTGQTNASYRIHSTESRGRHISLISAPVGTVTIYEEDGTTLFERSKVPGTPLTKASTTTIEALRGGVADIYTGWVGMIDDDVMIVSQDTYQSFLVARVDRNGTYGDNEGWGPTTDRYLIDRDDYEDMLRVPRIYSDGVNSGATLTDTRLTSPTAISNDKGINTITWTEALCTELKDNFIASDDVSSVTINDIRLCLNIFGDVLNGETLIAFMSYDTLVDAGDGSNNAVSYMYRVSVSVSGSVISDVTNIELVRTTQHSVRANNFNSGRDNDVYDSYGMNFYDVMSDGNLMIIINNGNLTNNVGSRSFPVLAITTDPSGNVLNAWARARNPASKFGYFYHPDFGAGLLSSAYRWEAIQLSVYGEGNDFLESTGLAVQSTQLIHTTNVATGLILYFTSEANFYCNRTLYTVPVGSIELAVSGLDEVLNTTVYIYVEIVDEEAIYSVSNEKLVDTDSRLYIGYCVTDDTQIIDIAVETATRLGDIYELTEHTEDVTAHGGTLQLDISDYGLDNLVNMGMLHELTLPTFLDVFNDYTRISHKADVEEQPAVPTETDKWSYDEDTDTVSCTVNSTSFIGLVTETEVGDHTFDTIVGSTGADNDGLIVVLAYGVDDEGKQHTICAVRAHSIQAHMAIDGQFDIWYNYYQADAIQIATGGLTEDSGGWSGDFSRVTSTRVGDMFTVTATPFVASSSVDDHSIGADAITHQFTLDDFPELAMFKSGAGFGYGAISQPAATFFNITRPDEDVGNYYASAESVRVMKSAISETVRVAGGIISGGETIPVPAGFTVDDCEVILSYEKSGLNDYIRYFNITETDLTVTMDVRVAGGDLVTNPEGCQARYYLIARKRVEV